MLFLQIIMLLALAFISFQDWKERQVSVWLLVLTLLASVGLSYFLNQRLLIQNLKVNSMIVMVQLLLLYLFLIVRNKTIRFNPFHSFGGADLFFLIVLIPLIPFSQFLPFYMLSLITSLLVFLTIRKRLKERERIPLAGLMATCLSLFLINDWYLNWI